MNGYITSVTGSMACHIMSPASLDDRLVDGLGES